MLRIAKIAPESPSKAGAGAKKRHFLLGLILILGSWSAPAWSAFVTLHEAAVETIYTQVYTVSGYSGSTFDIIYGDVQELVAPELLSIDTSAEYYELNTLADAEFGLALTTVPMFWVDSITWCGSDGGNVVGCAGFSHAVIESSTAAGSVGDELVAHELAHTLGLAHPAYTSTTDDDGPNNLLQPILGNGQTELVGEQISGPYDLAGIPGNPILASPYVLGDLAMGDLHINIAPILVVAAASIPAPLPAPALLLAGALVPLLGRRRSA